MSREPFASETLIDRALAFARSTPHRTFVLYPLAVLLIKVVGSRGRPRLRWRYTPLLAWGYLQYRLCGEYRRPRAAGGWGMQTLLENLVTTGPYAYIRNPMYLGHIIFLTGLALFTRSKLVLLFTAGVALWFNSRVDMDERRLEDLWGEPYRAYKATVPRWLPRPPLWPL
jgi:hypothetical protein